MEDGMIRMGKKYRLKIINRYRRKILEIRILMVMMSSR
jgi:hypothetical protein